MSNITEESLNIHEKAVTQYAPTIYKALMQALEDLAKIAGKLHELATKDKVKEMVASKAPLKQIEIQKEEIKELSKLFKDSKIPCAFLELKDGTTQCVFFESHVDLVKENVLEKFLKEKMNETKDEQPRNNNQESRERTEAPSSDREIPTPEVEMER